MDKKFLIKDHWGKSDISEFQEYLKSLSKGKEKAVWEQKIVNTSLPCLAVSAEEVKDIVSMIAKGNYMEFLEHWLWKNHTETVINGGLICKIKDFKVMKEYLIKYSECADNWATIDSLKFRFRKDNKHKFIEFAKELLLSTHTFSRRLGIIILLKLCDEEEFIDEILTIANTLTAEQEYYVNMANAWLIAECFVNFRDKTLEMLSSHKLNKFTINKAISKCRDSLRISREDKELLHSFKQK